MLPEAALAGVVVTSIAVRGAQQRHAGGVVPKLCHAEGECPVGGGDAVGVGEELNAGSFPAGTGLRKRRAGWRFLFTIGMAARPMLKGVRPTPSPASTGASRSSSTRAASTCPSLAAQCSGMHPSSSRSATPRSGQAGSQQTRSAAASPRIAAASTSDGSSSAVAIAASSSAMQACEALMRAGEAIVHTAMSWGINNLLSARTGKLGRAPCSSSSWTASACPFSAAICRGLIAPHGPAFGSTAPRSSSRRATSRYLSSIARCSGVSPSPFRASATAPCSNSTFVATNPPDNAATCSGVWPITSFASIAAPCSRSSAITAAPPSLEAMLPPSTGLGSGNALDDHTDVLGVSSGVCIKAAMCSGHARQPDVVELGGEMQRRQGFGSAANVNRSAAIQQNLRTMRVAAAYRDVQGGVSPAAQSVWVGSALQQQGQHLRGRGQGLREAASVPLVAHGRSVRRVVQRSAALRVADMRVSTMVEQQPHHVHSGAHDCRDERWGVREAAGCVDVGVATLEQQLAHLYGAANNPKVERRRAIARARVRRRAALQQQAHHRNLAFVRRRVQRSAEVGVSRVDVRPWDEDGPAGVLPRWRPLQAPREQQQPRGFCPAPAGGKVQRRRAVSRVRVHRRAALQ
eukprot:scaffold266_cov391-Prasinococcus_capsulatus_cf.AAC.47